MTKTIAKVTTAVISVGCLVLTGTAWAAGIPGMVLPSPDDVIIIRQLPKPFQDDMQSGIGWRVGIYRI